MGEQKRQHQGRIAYGGEMSESMTTIDFVLERLLRVSLSCDDIVLMTGAGRLQSIRKNNHEIIHLLAGHVLCHRCRRGKHAAPGHP